MDELRLVGVHDDGEHLVLQDASGTRHVLRIDQQLRGTVQRARRVAPRRQGSPSGDFGPRDIQARFRAGATVEEIVEESGWEPERVRRYEWPILAERAHIAREAQKVEVVARTTRSGGYRSVFDGEAQSLAQIVAAHAGDLGIAPTSLDWDAWQRPDQQWQITARFRIADPGAAPQDLVDQQPAALWIFNPASLTVTPDNGWAGQLTATPDASGVFVGSDSLFGAPSAAATTSGTREPARGHRPASVSGPDERAQQAGAEAAAPSQTEAEASAGLAGQDTDELLDVLEARRGQRLGQDSDSDDQLAEILGRSMGHIDRRPRPISAPKDSPLFDRPMHPSHPAGQRTGQAPADERTAGTGASGVPAHDDRSSAAEDPSEATVHHLGRADAQDKPDSPVIEIMDDDSRPLDGDEPVTREPGAQESEAAPAVPSAPRPAGAGPEQAGTAAEESGPADAPAEESIPAPDHRPDQQHEVRAVEATSDGTETGGTPLRSVASPGPAAESPAEDENGQEEAPRDESNRDESSPDETTEAEASEPEQPSRPRPRGRTNSKRSRSSVPSWDEIVFGAKNTDS